MPTSHSSSSSFSSSSLSKALQLMEFDYFQNSIPNDVLMYSDTSNYLDADQLLPLPHPFHAFADSCSYDIGNPLMDDVCNFPNNKLFHSLASEAKSTSNRNKSMDLCGGYLLNRTSMARSVESFIDFKFSGNEPYLFYLAGDKSDGQSHSQCSSTATARRNSNGLIHKKTNVIKGQWTLEEDKLLVKLVEQHGLRKWSHIAQMLNGRIGKQCRERWHNHLRPNIKKDTWSEEEDKILIEAHSEIGNKWAEIAKMLPGRTENSIKNHWNATKRKQFARRRCRISKNPKSGTGSLLQNYIKSLSFLSPTPLRETSEMNGTAIEALPQSSMQLMPVKSAWDDFSDVAEELMMLDKKEMALMSNMCDVGYLIDHLGCGGENGSSGDSSSSNNSVMRELEQCLSERNGVKVKKEMDLMEMISDHQNSSSFSAARDRCGPFSY